MEKVIDRMEYHLRCHRISCDRKEGGRIPVYNIDIVRFLSKHLGRTERTISRGKVLSTQHSDSRRGG